MWEKAALGWTDALEQAFRPHEAGGLSAGRVAAEHQHLYTLLTEHGELLAHVAGRLRHEAAGRADFPAVGDWVALKPRTEERRATIHAILPRRSRFSRKLAGETTDEQVVAANVDTVLLVMGLDGDYNPRRLERYLALAWASGADPAVLLNKTDVCDDAEARRREIQALGAPTHLLSARTGAGFEELAPYLLRGRTLALLGSSGVGKSSIVNRLLGEERFATREVRQSDDRGRHATTMRQLVPLPGGALVIDTPGMRELQLWETGGGLEAAFADVEAVAERCRYADCRHEAEPGCAVKRAVEKGELPAERLQSYHKLQRELELLVLRQDVHARREEKRRWRSIHRLQKRHKPRG